MWVIAGNAHAIRFYLAAGFAAEPSPIKACTLGGETLQDVRYKLALEGRSATLFVFPVDH
jgi:hypothetical protein